MPDRTKQFYEAIEKEMTMVLATSSGGCVTMRTVSPVHYNGGILIFTAAASKKYRQLKENPLCCISVGGFFAECKAEFYGKTSLKTNALFRDAYCKKFSGAFDDGIEFGGRDAEFILFQPTRISGWAFAEGQTDETVPTIPFDIIIN